MSAVELSGLNRAALAAKEGYGWIHFLAFAYCVVIGMFSVAAWVAGDQPFRAAVCAGAQILSVIMALLARRGFTGQMGVAGFACVAIAFGFSLWAAEGLQHAWTTNGAQIEEWQVWFLTGSEPAIFLLIEHIKEGRETLRAAQKKADKAEQELADELAAIRAKSSANRLAGDNRPADQPASGDLPDDARQAGEKSPVARLRLVERPVDQPAADEIDRQVVDAYPDQPVEEIPPLTTPAHSESTFADPVEHAKHLIANEGVRHRNELVRRARGLTTYRATQLLDEFSPGWRTNKRAAAA